MACGWELALQPCSTHAWLHFLLHFTPSIPNSQEFIPAPPKNKKQAVNEAVLWGYVPALDPRGLQRGLLQHGDPARMRRALHKLLSGEKVVVAAVGGSITVGRGSATQVSRLLPPTSCN